MYKVIVMAMAMAYYVSIDHLDIYLEYAILGMYP